MTGWEPPNHSGRYPAPEPLYVAPTPGLHMPMRPTWTCTGCVSAWPCDTKKRMYLALYEDAWISLHLLMAMRFCDAAGDLRSAEAGELYDRFLGWVRAARHATGQA